MADRNKFEEMLERLINEDREGAEELFHEIVVEKSRDIYESLLEDDAEIEEESDEEVDEAADEEVDESDEDLDESADEDDEDEEMDEGFDLDEFEVEADDDMGGDPMDDMMSDMEPEDDEEGDMDMGDDDMEDRMDDVEDALEKLQAEFDKMMAGDDEEGEMDDDEEGEEEPEEESFAFEDEEVEEDEEVDEATDEEVEESKGPKSDIDMMREYVEKVSGGGLDAQKSAPMGDNGANAKSPVAGKNDMGGTASNLNQGKDNEAGDHAGLGDLNAKDQTGGNVNVPGSKNATKMSSTKGHGAEKKGSAPEKPGAGSPINGVKTRAK
jgi:hypothetical protein